MSSAAAGHRVGEWTKTWVRAREVCSQRCGGNHISLQRRGFTISACHEYPDARNDVDLVLKSNKANTRAVILGLSSTDTNLNISGA